MSLPLMPIDAPHRVYLWIPASWNSSPHVQDLQLLGMRTCPDTAKVSSCRCEVPDALSNRR
jgi:hypothetical protein